MEQLLPEMILEINSHLNLRSKLIFELTCARIRNIIFRENLNNLANVTNEFNRIKEAHFIFLGGYDIDKLISNIRMSDFNKKDTMYIEEMNNLEILTLCDKNYCDNVFKNKLKT
jgi:hypothetical protein